MHIREPTPRLNGKQGVCNALLNMSLLAKMVAMIHLKTLLLLAIAVIKLDTVGDTCFQLTNIVL